MCGNINRFRGEVNPLLNPSLASGAKEPYVWKTHKTWEARPPPAKRSAFCPHPQACKGRRAGLRLTERAKGRIFGARSAMSMTKEDGMTEIMFGLTLGTYGFAVGWGLCYLFEEWLARCGYTIERVVGCLIVAWLE